MISASDLWKHRKNMLISGVTRRRLSHVILSHERRQRTAWIIIASRYRAVETITRNEIRAWLLLRVKLSLANSIAERALPLHAAGSYSVRMINCDNNRSINCECIYIIHMTNSPLIISTCCFIWFVMGTCCRHVDTLIAFLF